MYCTIRAFLIDFDIRFEKANLNGFFMKAKKICANHDYLRHLRAFKTASNRTIR